MWPQVPHFAALRERRPPAPRGGSCFLGNRTAVLFVALVWLVAREARKDRELEAKLSPEELMKKRVIEGNGLGQI